MSKTYAHYTESTKRNVVAAVRSGLSRRGLGKRLSIPETTISQWVHSPRYSDVAPASEEVLTAIPSLPCSENDSPSGFLKVRKVPGPGLRIRLPSYGNYATIATEPTFKKYAYCVCVRLLRRKTV